MVATLTELSLCKQIWPNPGLDTGRRRTLASPTLGHKASGLRLEIGLFSYYYCASFINKALCDAPFSFTFRRLGGY